MVIPEGFVEPQQQKMERETLPMANREKGAMFFPYLSNNTITAVELYTSYMIERKSLHVDLRRYSNFS